MFSPTLLHLHKALCLDFVGSFGGLTSCLDDSVGGMSVEKWE